MTTAQRFALSAPVTPEMQATPGPWVARYSGLVRDHGYTWVLAVEAMPGEQVYRWHASVAAFSAQADTREMTHWAKGLLAGVGTGTDDVRTARSVVAPLVIVNVWRALTDDERLQLEAGAA